MDVTFRPIRLVNREVIDTFRCIPVTEKSDGTRTADKRLLLHDKDVMGTTVKNAEVLSKAFQALQKAFDAGNRYRMIVPINSYSLATNESTTLIVRAIKELDSSVRGAVIAEFVDFPASLTLDMLGDMTVPVLPFFDKYMAEPPPISNKDGFTMYANCNYFGVSLNMDTCGDGEDAATGLLTKFWAEATKNRLKVVIQGVKDPEIVAKIEQYEIFAFDGPILGEDRDTLI